MVRKPTLLKRPLLKEVPASLKKSIAKGIVLIKAHVDSSGNVKEAELIKNSNLEDLDVFLIDWVKTWIYLPRLFDGEAQEGYTVITIRYDLVTQTFEAPLPLNKMVQIHHDIELNKNENTDITKQNELVPTPKKKLAIESIPIKIQNLNLIGEAIISFEIRPDGYPENLAFNNQDFDDDFANWILDCMKTTQWHFHRQINGHYVELPIKYNTMICVIEFGNPEYKN